MRKIRFIFSFLAICAAVQTLANEKSLGFGNLSEDTKKPIITSSDQMTVDNKLSQAELIGNVEIVQGNLLLYADYVRVTYSEDQSKIDAIFALDNVILISGEDRATADEADYNLDRGTIVMIGNALDQDYSSGTLFFLYLIPRGLRIILPYLQNLGKKIRVVTYMSPFPEEVVPAQIVKVTTANHEGADWPLWVYELGAD